MPAREQSARRVAVRTIKARLLAAATLSCPLDDFEARVRAAKLCARRIENLGGIA